MNEEKRLHLIEDWIDKHGCSDHKSKGKWNKWEKLERNASSQVWPKQCSTHRGKMMNGGKIMHAIVQYEGFCRETFYG